MWNKNRGSQAPRLPGPLHLPSWTPTPASLPGSEAAPGTTTSPALINGGVKMFWWENHLYTHRIVYNCDCWWTCDQRWEPGSFDSGSHWMTKLLAKTPWCSAVCPASPKVTPKQINNRRFSDSCHKPQDSPHFSIFFPVESDLFIVKMPQKHGKTTMLIMFSW